MDYDFRLLGPRDFEHLAQSLAAAALKTGLSIFGDGSDGGREATWNGDAESQGAERRWHGYGVIQAKAKLDEASTPKANFTWLKAQIAAEFKEWKSHDDTRPNPDYYLLITNVRLSPRPGGGKDSASQYLAEQARSAGLSVREVRIWDADDLRVLLDEHESIRNRYLAWLTPSDVLSKLVSEMNDQALQFHEATQLHAANQLRREANLKLNQTGTVRDQPIGLSQVFIDLPLDSTHPFVLPDSQTGTKATAHFLRIADEIPVEESKLIRKYVLVGGPGQGKSTVTQYIAQYYRALFIMAPPLRADPVVHQEITRVLDRADAINLVRPRAHRWPFRVILPDLADAMAIGRATSLLDYIRQEINSRSGIATSPEQLRSWLQGHPWILLLDGLDEVPATSNRDQLMSTLADFYNTAMLLGADLVTISTTRPQGYNDEFGEAEHHTLSPLDDATAMGYATTFLTARNGVDEPQNDRTLSLLQASLSESGTRRLFTTPLQVTILAVLMERLGHAPNDRWRLFSAYYQVISQREQEKPGELATLLQHYSSEVDYIHHLCGYELQVRGSQAGNAAGQLTRTELRGIIHRRLSDQGYEDDQASALADQFMKLATERLVFLAMLTADTVGFEIRSFQEFMAAERIVVDDKNDEIADNLRLIATKPYWRNTLLFALGRIFNQHESLKPFVLSLCSELDMSGDVHGVLNWGKNLALDIIEDGACSTQPRYSKPLAQLAATLVQGPSHVRVPELAAIKDPVVAPIISDEIEKAALGRAGDRVGAAIFFSSRDDLERLEEIYQAGDKIVQVGILQAAWLSRSEGLRELARIHCVEHDPKSYVADGDRQFALLGDMNVADEAWDALGRAVSYGAIPHIELRIASSIDGKPGLGYMLPRVSSDHSCWRPLVDLSTHWTGWQLALTAARFLVIPDTDSLANYIEAIASAGYSTFSSMQMPWLVEWLVSKVDGEIEDAREREAALFALAEDARGGKYGSGADWVAYEEKLSSLDVIDFSAADISLSIVDALPSLHELLSVINPMISIYSNLSADDQTVVDDTTSILDALAAFESVAAGPSLKCARRATLTELGLMNNFRHEQGQLNDLPRRLSDVLYDRFSVLSRATIDSGSPSAFAFEWIQRIDHAILAYRLEPEALFRVVSLMTSGYSQNTSLSLALLDRYRVDSDHRPLLWAVKINPWIVSSVDSNTQRLLTDDPHFEDVRDLARITGATVGEVACGAIDSAILRVLAAPSANPGRGFESLRNVLEQSETSLSSAVAARSAHLLYASDISDAGYFADLAEDLAQASIADSE